jgi:CBS domain-containing protein
MDQHQPPAVVADVMSPEVTTLMRNDTLSLADDIMNLGRIRHLPVLDDDEQLVGLVSQRDLFRGSLARALGYGDLGQRRLLDTIMVKEVMTEDVVSTTADTPIQDAARLMLERKIGCLPVLERERLVGIVTEADFVALVALGAAAD